MRTLPEGFEPDELRRRDFHVVQGALLSMRTDLTQAQAAFLADLGIGREVFAPNPSVKKALWERKLIATRFIGQRWWWCQPTQAGKDALAAWNAKP